MYEKVEAKFEGDGDMVRDRETTRTYDLGEYTYLLLSFNFVIILSKKRKQIEVSTLDRGRWHQMTKKRVVQRYLPNFFYQKLLPTLLTVRHVSGEPVKHVTAMSDLNLRTTNSNFYDSLKKKKKELKVSLKVN